MKKKKKDERRVFGGLIYGPGRSYTHLNSRRENDERKRNKRIVLGYLIFMFIILWFTPVFEMISDLFKYGLFKNIDSI